MKTAFDETALPFRGAIFVREILVSRRVVWLVAALALPCCGDGAQPAVPPAAADGGGACPAPVNACPPAPPSYAAEVQPLLGARCAPCHFPGGTEATRPLTDYAHVFPQRGALLGQLASCVMPPQGAVPLGESERARLLAWLACGAPDN